MKERLTKRNEHGETRHATPLKGQSIREIEKEAGKRDAVVLRRLCELEDQLENGELVSKEWHDEQVRQAVKDAAKEILSEIWNALAGNCEEWIEFEILKLAKKHGVEVET